MVAKKIEDLVAFQLAVEFKREVYRLLSACGKPIDFKYRSQISDATSAVEADLSEGFARDVPGEFAQFIRYGRASLAEARQRLRDGIDRGYFSEADCREALSLGRRCADCLRKLFQSLEPFLSRPRVRPQRRR
jgi:four helix bundle protein